MNKIKSLIFTLIVILPVSSCLKEKREATYNSQEDKIDKYISTNMYKKTGDITDTLRVEYRGGASRLVITEGNGEKLKADGMVSLYYAGYTFTGNKSSLVFPEQCGVTNTPLVPSFNKSK